VKIDQVRRIRSTGGTRFILTFRPIALHSNTPHLAATVTEVVYDALVSHAGRWTIEEIENLECSYRSSSPSRVTLDSEGLPPAKERAEGPGVTVAA
jgi:hypothetical protein